MCVLSTYLPVQNRSLKTIHIFIGDNLRPMGCPGIDDEFGNRTHRLWPFRNNKNTANYASRQMVCGVNEYIPEGEDKPVYQVVDELAADNELFAEHFLDGWHIMTTHGYAETELNDGPQNSWMGYERLAAQGVVIDDYEKYISENKPVDFVDPKVTIDSTLIISLSERTLTKHCHYFSG